MLLTLNWHANYCHNVSSECSIQVKLENHYAMSKLKRSMPMQAIRITSDKTSQPMIKYDDIMYAKIKIRMIQAICESIHKILLITMKNNELTRFNFMKKEFCQHHDART